MAAMLAASVNASAQDSSTAPFKWTGFYFGFQGSYHTGQSDWEMDYGSDRINHSLNGGMGGFYLGYAFQTAPGIVAGIETEMNYGRLDGSSSCPNSSYSCHTDVSWIGSTRGRFGYAVGRFLPFVTIGWAYAGADTYVKSLSSGREYGKYHGYFGFTPGAGFELAITNNLLLRAEYSYYYFFRTRVDVHYEDVDVKIDDSAFKVGLTLKF